MRYWKKYLLIMLAILIWMSLHIIWQYSKQIPSELEAKTIAIKGTIVSLPITKQFSTRFLFNTKEFGKIQLDWYRSAPLLQEGQIWELNVRLKKPHGYKNPGGFNYERYLFLKYISATGYVVENAKKTLLYSPDKKTGLRQSIANQIDSVLDHRQQASLIKGLAVGIRDTMTDTQWELLQKTGTSHLLAISGLHIGLVSGFVFFLVRFLWAHLPRLPLYMPAPNIAACAAMIAALIYSALAGFSIPTVRALLMIIILMICICIRFSFKKRDILFFAGLIIIIEDPFALMSASFWLSFIAVGLLFAMNLQKAPKWRQFIRIQWFISLGLIPFVIAYFQQISWISPLANMVAIPWASFTIVPLTLLGVAVSFINLKLAAFFWLLAESALYYLQIYLQYLADFPWAWQSYVVSDWRVWLAIALCGVLLLLPRGIPGKILGLILFCAILFVRHPKPEPGEAWLTVLDVGQGLAVLLQTQEHVLLYDAGMRYDHFDIGESVIMPFLRYQGIEEIDMLVLSHDNLDHTGGAHYLIEHLPIQEIKSGEAISGLSINDRCIAGQSWEWDQIQFKFLYPYQENPNNSNENSCVLKITVGEKNILLTGDIEKQGEAWLVKHAAVELKTHILIAPHHGSKTSSTLPFVQKTQPEHVVFSAGYRNRYDFPRKDVVERYTVRGAIAYNTALEGAISFQLK